MHGHQALFVIHLWSLFNGEREDPLSACWGPEMVSFLHFFYLPLKVLSHCEHGPKCFRNPLICILPSINSSICLST